MHYYQFNIKAYYAATAHLSPLEDLTYRRLIDHYMDTEKPIPDDFTKIARRLRINKDEAQAVLQEFFTSTLDGWRNEKCDAQIAAYQAQSERNRTNGKKGGRPKDSKTQSEPTRLAKTKGGLESVSEVSGIVEPVSVVPSKTLVKKARSVSDKPAAESTASKEKTHSQPTGNPKERQLLTNNNKQITNNKTHKPAAKASGRISATGVDGLMALGVSEQVAFDYLAVRKARRLPLTQTALDQIQREADKAGITIAEAILISAGNGWAGFKADWLKNQMSRESVSFIAEHTDKSWAESFIQKHTDTSWREGINADGTLDVFNLPPRTE